MLNFENLENWEQKQINEFVEAVKNTGGRCVVCHITPSKSGMSRKISFAYAGKDGQILNLYHILELCGYKLDDKWQINIKGCGMDMVWDTLSIIYTKIGIDEKEANILAGRYYAL